jgi:hypothetical protein
MIHAELPDLPEFQHPEMPGRMAKGRTVPDKELHPVMLVWRQCRHGMRQVASHPLARFQQGFGTLQGQAVMAVRLPVGGWIGNTRVLVQNRLDLCNSEVGQAADASFSQFIVTLDLRRG